jgi:hypothetical protein
MCRIRTKVELIKWIKHMRQANTKVEDIKLIKLMCQAGKKM